MLSFVERPQGLLRGIQYLLEKCVAYVLKSAMLVPASAQSSILNMRKIVSVLADTVLTNVAEYWRSSPSRRNN